MRQVVAYWLGEESTGPVVTLAPYGQAVEELLNPIGSLSANDGGTNVVVLRADDLVAARGGRPGVGGLPTASAVADPVIVAIDAAVAAFPARLLVCLTPASPDDAPEARLADEVRRRLERHLATAPGVDVLDLSHVVTRYQLRQVHDPYTEQLAGMPYSGEYLAAVATEIARRVCLLTRPPRKMIVLDCDDTLWQGRCSEDGPQGVVVTRRFETIQQFMVEQRREGRLLCLCSRNSEADVVAAFHAHPHMPLSWSDITAHRIGWDRKSVAIRSLADELGVALDAVIFVDDDPVECAEVTDALADVAVVELPAPEPEGITSYLDHVWVFDQLWSTPEDAMRAEGAQVEQARHEIRRTTRTFADFVAELRIVADLLPLDAIDVERAAQLSARTNQFTNSPKRWSVAELLSRVDDVNHPAWILSVRDRLGDYGKVGLAIAVVDDHVLRIDALSLSCRVLNRGVEHRFLTDVARRAASVGCEVVEIEFTPTPRNEPMARFLHELRCETRPLADGGVVHRAGAFDLVRRLETGPTHESEG